MPGAVGARCGSLASSGLPSAVRLPEITQLLLAARSSAEIPMRSSESNRTLSSASAIERRLSETGPAVVASPLPGGFVLSKQNDIIRRHLICQIRKFFLGHRQKRSPHQIVSPGRAQGVSQYLADNYCIGRRPLSRLVLKVS